MLTSVMLLVNVLESYVPPLKHIFDLIFENGIFPDSLKIAKVTPVWKSGDSDTLSNYRPTSVIPCFSKMLENIMYTWLYNYLQENNILYSKQSGFQTGRSTDHVIVQLAEQIYEDFEENKYTLEVFIDLAKAFDTVNHEILLTNLEINGIDGITLKLFNKQKTIYSEKQYQKHRFKGCCMWSSPGISIRSSLIFDICKRTTIWFKFVRPHYVCWWH